MSPHALAFRRQPVPRALLGILLTIVLATGPVGPAAAFSVVVEQEFSDAVDLTSSGRDGEALSDNAAVALRAARLAFTAGGVEEVVIARDDTFPDALAAGPLLHDRPLVLVPSSGEIPSEVTVYLRESGATMALVLGGPAAVGDGVVGQLQDLGLSTARLFGESRFETAVAIAAATPPATTVLIARAHQGLDSVDPTQAFADSLTAAAWAAESGLPLVLSGTDGLPTPTADHLATRGYDRAVLIGGEAALGEQVEQEVAALVGQVERVAGPTRFHTAVEVASRRQMSRGGTLPRVAVIEGQDADSWAAGFALAPWSARANAPIVLINGSNVPDVTLAHLRETDMAGHASGGAPMMVCAGTSPICPELRDEVGLPSPVDIDTDPIPGSRVAPGKDLDVTVTGQLGGRRLEAAGDCVEAGTSADVRDGHATIRLAAAFDAPTHCELRLTVTLPNGATQTQSTAYERATSQTAELTELTVTVEDPEQNPAPGAIVTVLDGAGRTLASATTGPQSEVTLHVPTGPVRVAVTHPDFAEARQDVDVNGDQDVHVYLLPPSTVEVTVIDLGTGDPLPSATVEAVRDLGQRVAGTTNASGRVRLQRVSNETWTVTARRDGYLPQEQQLYVPFKDTVATTIAIAEERDGCQLRNARLPTELLDTSDHWALWWGGDGDEAALRAGGANMLAHLEHMYDVALALGFEPPPTAPEHCLNAYAMFTGGATLDEGTPHVGTDPGGRPYVGLPEDMIRAMPGLDALDDADSPTLSFVYHEGFHMFQYASDHGRAGLNVTFIESAASWFARHVAPDNTESLYAVFGHAMYPHLPIWGAIETQGPGDPVGPVVGAHAYGTNLWMEALTDAAGPGIMGEAHFGGHPTGTEGLFRAVAAAGEDMGELTADYAARLTTADFPGVTGEYLASHLPAMAEAHPDDDHRVAMTVGVGSGDVRPPAALRPGAFGHNVVRINPGVGGTRLTVGGDAAGTDGTPSVWHGRVVIRSGDTRSYRTLDLRDGSDTIELITPSDAEIFLVVVAAPELFDTNEQFGYRVSASELA